MFGLTPWLQLPIVLAVALPLSGVLGWVILRTVDFVGRVLTRRRGG